MCLCPPGPLGLIGEAAEATSCGEELNPEAHFLLKADTPVASMLTDLTVGSPPGITLLHTWPPLVHSPPGEVRAIIISMSQVSKLRFRDTSPHPQSVEGGKW